MKTSSAKRTFRTPSLEAGQTYYYVLRAEIVRDGKTYSETKRILVRAGDELAESFKDLASETKAVASR